jgi:hypothetical protein
VALRPSTQDLEAAAEGLITLRRRGRASWSTEEFGSLTRASGRFRGEEMLAFQQRCGLLERVDDGWRLSETGEAVVEQLNACRTLQTLERARQDSNL